QFRAAASRAPTDPGPWLALADAYKQIGNDAAAVLALKQAESLTAGDDPALKRQRAELYRRMGQTKDAIATLLELRDANLLSGDETLVLARLQAQSGDVKGGYD